MKFGEKAFEVEASVHTILQCERLSVELYAANERHSNTDKKIR